MVRETELHCTTENAPKTDDSTDNNDNYNAVFFFSVRTRNSGGMEIRSVCVCVWWPAAFGTRTRPASGPMIGRVKRGGERQVVFGEPGRSHGGGGGGPIVTERTRRRPPAACSDGRRSVFVRRVTSVVERGEGGRPKPVSHGAPTTMK